MNFSEFQEVVKDEANKGDRLDSFIPERVRMAIQRIETNHTFKYMEVTTTLTLEAGETEVDVPERMKSVLMMRYTAEDGSYVYLHQVDPQDVSTLETDFPTGYWQEGTSTFHFDCEPTEDVTLTLLYARFTDIDGLEENAEVWLFDHAREYVLAMTMKRLSTVAREADWQSLYEEMQEEGERTAYIADQELRNATRDEVMVYANR